MDQWLLCASYFPLLEQGYLWQLPYACPTTVCWVWGGRDQERAILEELNLRNCTQRVSSVCEHDRNDKILDSELMLSSNGTLGGASIFCVQEECASLGARGWVEIASRQDGPQDAGLLGFNPCVVPSHTAPEVVCVVNRMSLPRLGYKEYCTFHCGPRLSASLSLFWIILWENLDVLS